MRPSLAKVVMELALLKLVILALILEISQLGPLFLDTEKDEEQKFLTEEDCFCFQRVAQNRL